MAQVQVNRENLLRLCNVVEICLDFYCLNCMLACEPCTNPQRITAESLLKSTREDANRYA